MSERAWFPFGAPGDGASVRLFCFPYAGGSASIYRSWRRGPHERALEVCPVQLPGREARVREAPFRSLDPLVEALCAALRPWLARPYALFGHSMGALVAFELAHRLRDLGLPEPVRLFVSGALAPGRAPSPTPIHALSDAAFIAALRDLSGTPEDVLAHRELMDLLLPALRADFEVCETYLMRERPPLASPITAFGGSDDHQVSPASLPEWSRMTLGGFDSVIIPGDHFFLVPRGEEIRRLVADRLASSSGA